jgi:hypothetical protein
MATSKNISIVIDGKDNTSTALKSVQKNLSATEKQTKSLTDKLGSLSSSLTGMGKKFSLFATTPLVALGTVAVKSGAELATLEDSYERLATNTGIASEEMLGKMKEVSKGTISNKDLILGANKAMSLGVVNNTEEMATIMEVARVKGQNMGLSMTQAFDDLVTGLGRGSAMILDNLGITVKVGEVNENYAKSIGKVASELTAEEQKQALVNAVVGQGKEELEAMGEVQMTQKERMEAFNASLVNLKDELGKELLPVVIKVMDKVSVWIEKFSNLDDRTKKIILVVAGLVAGIGPALMILGALTTAIQGVAVAFTFLTGPVGLIVLAIASVIAIVVLLIKHWDDVKVVTGKLGEFLKKTWEDISNWVNDKIQSMVDWFSNLINKIKDAISWLKRVSGFDAVSGAISSVFGGGKAVGGFVRQGTSYMVGEQGPEMFTPSQSGTIIPNNKLGGGGGNINVYVSGNTLMDRQAGEKIGDQIIKKLQLVTNI